MRPELGDELGRARATRALSLEAVSRAAKISQGYLHKLEAGRVENPSPRVLQRLSEVLEVPYRTLMELADYLLPVDDVAHTPRSPERTAMTDAAQTDPPTNRELQRLLERLLEQIAEIRRDQRQIAAALERVSRGDA